MFLPGITEVGPHPFMSKKDEIVFAKAAVRAFANGAEVLFFDYEPIALVMAYIIGDFEKVKKLGEGVYVFEVGGDRVYVVRQPGKIPVKEGQFYVSDIYGNFRKESVSKIKV